MAVPRVPVAVPSPKPQNKNIIKPDMESFNDVISGDVLTLVDFHATWCGPCKSMHPVLEQVKRRLGERIRIIKIDVDRHQALAAQYRVQSVPTFLLFRSGTLLHRFSGGMPAADLLSLLDPFLRG